VGVKTVAPLRVPGGAPGPRRAPLQSHALLGPWPPGGGQRVSPAVHGRAAACHADRGSPYAAYAYQARWTRDGLTASMSRKGNCWDNACIESWHSLLKKELVYLSHFRTRAEARTALFDYIAVFYHR